MHRLYVVVVVHLDGIVIENFLELLKKSKILNGFHIKIAS